MKPFPGLRALDELVPGQELKIGPYQFFVPPMLLKDLRVAVREGLMKKVAAIMRDRDTVEPDAFDEGVKAAVTMLHFALRRNYPAVTLEQLDDVIDVVNIADVINAVVSQNACAERPTWLVTDATSPSPSNGSASTTSSSGPMSNAAALPLSGGA